MLRFFANGNVHGIRFHASLGGISLRGDTFFFKQTNQFIGSIQPFWHLTLSYLDINSSI